MLPFPIQMLVLHRAHPQWIECLYHHRMVRILMTLMTLLSNSNKGPPLARAPWSLKTAQTGIQSAQPCCGRRPCLSTTLHSAHACPCTEAQAEPAQSYKMGQLIYNLSEEKNSPSLQLEA